MKLHHTKQIITFETNNNISIDRDRFLGRVQEAGSKLIIMTESEQELDTNNIHITKINFALHANVTLRVSLHKSIQANPHQIVTKLLALSGNESSEKFAILDAKSIVSLNQIAVGANSALMRHFQFELKNGSCNRGVALETILCCAGSTNTGSVMKEYAFDQHSVAAKDESNLGGGYDVLFLGYCESDEEFKDITTSMQLGVPENESGIEKYFSRNRNDKELADLMKIYKITKDEIEMCGSSLEKAVLNRVAAKFHI